MPEYINGVAVVNEDDVLKTRHLRRKSLYQALAPLTARLHDLGAKEAYYFLTPDQPRSPIMETRFISYDNHSPIGSAQITYDIEGCVATIDIRLEKGTLEEHAIRVRYPLTGGTPKTSIDPSVVSRFIDPTAFPRHKS